MVFGFGVVGVGGVLQVDVGVATVAAQPPRVLCGVFVVEVLRCVLRRVGCAVFEVGVDVVGFDFKSEGYIVGFVDL